MITNPNFPMHHFQVVDGMSAIGEYTAAFETGEYEIHDPNIGPMSLQVLEH